MFKGLHEINNHEDRRKEKKIREAQRLLNKENTTSLEKDKIQKYLNNKTKQHEPLFQTNDANDAKQKNKRLKEEQKYEKVRIIEEKRVLRQLQADTKAKEIEERLRTNMEKRQKEAEQIRRNIEQCQKEAEQIRTKTEERQKAEKIANDEYIKNKKLKIDREKIITDEIMKDYRNLKQTQNITMSQCYHKLSLKYHPDKIEGNHCEYMVILNSLRDNNFRYT